MEYLNYGALMIVVPVLVRKFRKLLSFVVFALAGCVFWIAFPKTLSGDETLWNELAFQAINSRLYVDVFDHKDPGFLYAIIWSYKLFGPIGLPILSFVTKFVVFFLPSIWLMWKNNYLDAAKVLLAALSFLLLPGMKDGSLPITLTNFFIVVSVVAALENKFFVSGLVGALTFFVKLSIAPTWLLAVVLVAFFYKNYSTQVRQFLAGASTSFVTISLLLWREGVLPNWAEVVRFNQQYSTAGPPVRLGLPVDNLGLLKHDVSRFDNSTKFVIFVSIVFIATFCVSKLIDLAKKNFRPLVLVVIFGSIGSMITLGLSYVWLHHVQVLLPWLILGAVVVITEPKSGFLRSYKYAFQISMVALLVTSFHTLRLNGIQMRASFDDRLIFPAHWNDEFNRGSTYGYLSQNTGFFGSQLPKNLKLNCPDLAVFPWTSYRLKAHKDCIAESDFVFSQELDFVGLDSGWGKDAVVFDAWVISVNRLITSDFCEVAPKVVFGNRGSVVKLFVNRSLKSDCN